MASLISIGVTGLTANQLALGTTGNNITNASVAGYSRQRVNLVTGPEQSSGVGFIGSGVQVDSVRRIVEQFVIKQLQQNTAAFHDVDAQSTQAGLIDSLLADQNTGVSPSLQTLFADLQQATQDPTSIPERQVVLNDASSLAQRFDALYSQLQDQSSNINQQLDSLTAQVSSMAQAIATLNRDISDATGSNVGAEPNALLDKRDELIRQVSELIGVSAVPQSNGMISLFVGNGQPLVVGTQANTLSTANSLNDPTRREVVFSAGGGSQPITQFVTGGTIGGLLKFRQNTLDTTLNTLGQIALNVADAMNQQQRMGLDLNGNFGGNLFTDINTASSMQTRALATNTNTGSAQLQVFIDNASALTTGDYRLNFTSATAYQLVNANGSALTPPVTGAIGALPATIATADGFQIRVPTGSTFAAGDSFIIQPTRQGASALNVALQKPEELAFAQPIRTSANLSNRGGGGISAGSMIAAYQANGTTREPTFATNGALTPPILIRFTSATTFDILDNTNPAAPVAITTGVAFTPGQNNTVTINDTVTGDPVYKFDVYGNPATGDQFNVNYNTNGSSDNRNALALTALQQTKTIGNASFDDAYGQLVATVGSNAAQLKINSDAADSVLTQTQASRDAVSGVNLDEEAANLIKYQQAYNASAQIITVARSLFDTLLAAFR